MPYQLTVPDTMRVFLPVNPGAKLMRPKGGTVFAGEVVKIDGVAIVSYDHCDKLALKRANNEGYLLIQELDDQISRLAHQWTHAYEESVLGRSEQAKAEGKKKMSEKEKALAPLMRKYVRPELHVVGDTPLATFDKQGPGILPVFW